MAYLQIPSTVTALRAHAKQPYQLGRACGELKYSIPALVADHLDHAANFRSKPPRASIDSAAFAASVDYFLYTHRTADGVTDVFPDDLRVGSKQRKPRRKYLARYTALLEKAFEGVIVSQLRDILCAYDVVNTQAFNAGIDYGLNGSAFELYPVVNVVLESGNVDWSTWLKVQCDQLVRMRSRYS